MWRSIISTFAPLRTSNLEVFNLSISNVNTSIDGTSAEVSLYTLITFRYPELDEPSACGDNYTVYFEKIGDEWCIADIYAEEIEAYRLTWEQFDCAEAIEAFDAYLLTDTSTEAELISPGSESSVELNAAVIDLGGDNRRVYQPFNAIAYAYTYTDPSNADSV